MAADTNTQTSVVRTNNTDYPQYSELETATIASAKCSSLGLHYLCFKSEII